MQKQFPIGVSLNLRMQNPWVRRSCCTRMYWKNTRLQWMCVVQGPTVYYSLGRCVASCLPVSMWVCHQCVCCGRWVSWSHRRFFFSFEYRSYLCSNPSSSGLVHVYLLRFCPVLPCLLFNALSWSHSLPWLQLCTWFPNPHPSNWCLSELQDCGSSCVSNSTKSISDIYTLSAAQPTSFGWDCFLSFTLPA